ncbi:hypothetical protein MOQ_003843 [Trypanosoma cruzi marinkellei]|uniref:Uncharacterized protein n=1 Tax=Trypanosoma cruzi marinkellei TaxID=85056 RepID=K2N2Z3_TRYCR|nr:hypothetical protein MOQ_003843 [Trypanosoma cruzi marinkellei]
MFDLRTLRTIISHAVALATPSPPPPPPHFDGTSVTLLSTNAAEDYDADSCLSNAVFSAIQPSTRRHSLSSVCNGSTTASNSATGGKGGKGTKGTKKSAAATPSTSRVASPIELKNMGANGTSRSRAEWYSVVESRQWGVPVVFIHQLPELDRPEGEGGALTAAGQGAAAAAASDFCTLLHKALQVIAEDMNATVGLHDDSPAGLSSMEGTNLSKAQHETLSGEQPRHVHEKEFAVVLALQDPRVLPGLLNRRTALTHPIDTRLIVNFVDGRHTELSGTFNQGSASSRSRTSAVSKRTNPRESPLPTPRRNSKDADGTCVPSDNNNTLDAWIERQQREGMITVTTPPTGDAHASGAICLREVFEEGGEDKRVWVQRCVQEVLPAMHNVVRDITRYGEWISSKTVYSIPITSTTPRPRMQPQTKEEEFPTMSESAVESSGVLRLRKSPTTALTPSFSPTTSTRTGGVDEDTFQFSPISGDFLPSHFAAKQLLDGEDEKWSYYVRERKVRGQWTCASAARALATQVTVLLARQQQPRVICPAPDEESCTLMDLVNECNEPCAADSMKEKSVASLLLQLRQYGSQRTVLSTLGADNIPDMTTGEGKEPSVVAESPDGLQLLENFTTGETSQLLLSAKATLPMDHTMDRPTHPPSPEEIRWVTREFIKKGIGAFAFPPAGYLRDDAPSMLSTDQLKSAIKMQELLEETLNGHTLNDGEDAMDSQLLHLIEEDFKRAKKEISCDWSHVWDNIALPVGLVNLDEKLRRSIERSLTTRERTHILQQIYLSQLAMESCMTGMAAPTNRMVLPNHGVGNLLTYSGISNDEGVDFNLRSVEECMTMGVAIRRLYEFQSRFGFHICRLIRCFIPDTLETLGGNVTAMYSRLAENVHPTNRVRAMMLGGVPIPRKRQLRQVWCYYVSGIPSVDVLNELHHSQRVSTSFYSDTSSAAPVGITTRNTTSTSFGGVIGDLLRQKLLQNLQKSVQLLSLPAENKVRVKGVCFSEEALHIALEGRHILYPCENSIVEVVTTDRSRICRYVKSSELTCTLHYCIPPPPPLPTNTGNADPATAFSASSNSTPRKRPREANAHFTTTFDDGVVFTCTPQWTTRAEHETPRGAGERENVASAGSISLRSGASRRSKAMSKAGRRTANVSVVLAGGGPPSGRRGLLSGRQRRRSRDDGEAFAAASDRSTRTENIPRIFPVSQDGSVCLWTAGPENMPGNEAANGSGSATPRAEFGAIPNLAITVAANGVTVHCEEQEGILWFTQHESSHSLVPELLRCMHVYDANATWHETMEVEVRRAVLEEVGAVCRYFHSGVTQTMYPDGAVVTRYPMPTNNLGGIQDLCETLVTATGTCYVRQVRGGYFSPFLNVKRNNLKTHVAYDRGNHCRVVSRADGVIIAFYYFYSNPHEPRRGHGRGGRNMNRNNGTKEHRAEEEGDDDDDDDDDDRCVWSKFKHPGFDKNVIARVTLHADSTCITTFSSQATQEAWENPPRPLKTLFEHVSLVGTACSGIVQYCIEAPSLPRVFVCAPTYSNNWSSTEEQQGASIPSTGGADSPFGAPNTSSLSKCNNSRVADAFPSSFLANPTPLPASGVKERSFPVSPRCKPYDSFYIVFGDGSVLRRRVLYRGVRGTVTSFLETLFVRSTSTSIRVIHESGLAIVEPSEALRRNMEAVTSLAIGEGLAMFDMALGGLRLVDYQHHLTEVHGLYSPGPVSAGIKSATLEFLLRQLVLPTYTPHTVTKARQEEMRQDEKVADAESRANRAKGICAPLATRLRELAEGFVIEHNLLRTDILNTATRQWECGNLGTIDKKATRDVTSGASWGKLTTHVGTSSSAVLKTLESPAVPAKMARTVGVLPILFSEFENDIVVQYIHHHDLENYMHAQEAEPIPVFLSHSTASGEPGVQQLTFFRTEADAGTAEAPTVGDPASRFFLLSRSFSGQLCSSSGSPNGQGGAVRMGSLLSEVVQRQEKLAFFSGRRVLFPTTQWLPPAMQPPRRFLKPLFHAKGNDKHAGITILAGEGVGNNGGVDGLPSSYEKLRILFKFSDVAPMTQRLVLASEIRRHEQLSSMMTHQKAINALAPKIPYGANEEQRRLREKYLAAAT